MWRCRAEGGREGGRALTVFSLSLSTRPFMGDRFFIGDWLFLGDPRGWSWRAASGARADSMVEAAAAAGRAAGNGLSRAGPLYALRSWRQNGRLATHSPRHAHRRPPPRSHWLVPRVGPRLPLWWRRREEEPRPWFWRQRRADKAGERSTSRPAPTKRVPRAGPAPHPCLGKIRLPWKSPKLVWGTDLEMPLCFALPFSFSGPSYPPIYFDFQH